MRDVIGTSVHTSQLRPARACPRGYAFKLCGGWPSPLSLPRASDEQDVGQPAAAGLGERVIRTECIEDLGEESKQVSK